MHLRSRISVAGTARRWGSVRATWAIFAAVVAATVIAGSATAWATVPIGAFSKFTVQADTSSDGRVFLGGKNAQVLDKVSVSPPGSSCGSGWQVSVANNTDFVLNTPTVGDVTASHSFPVPGFPYLFPGETEWYCVQFTQLNQIFFVRYDMTTPFARVADAVVLVTGAMGLPTDDYNALASLVSAVASIPDMQRIGACLRNRNPLCTSQAINALMTNASSRDALVSALTDYIVNDLGPSVAQAWLDHQLGTKTAQKQLTKAVGKLVAKDLAKYLSRIITTASWDVKLIGQALLSPARLRSFQTAP